MRPNRRLSFFAAGLAVLFGSSLILGATLGPTPSKASGEEPPPKGMGVVEATDGYRFVPLGRTLPPAASTFEFQVEGPKGRIVKAFTPTHEKLLHLIVVSRDLTVYYHVHPRLSADGTWSIGLPALPPGPYRAIADFKPRHGPHLALGTDLDVPGDYRPGQLPNPALVSTVAGFRVDMAEKRSRTGEVRFTLTVSQDGHSVVLEHYLGALGHVVAVRVGDLAYAHVHPQQGVPEPPGTVVFDSMLDAEGRYGLFFDFKYAGVVHTARFTFDQGVVTDAPSMGS